MISIRTRFTLSHFACFSLNRQVVLIKLQWAKWHTTIPHALTNGLYAPDKKSNFVKSIPNQNVEQGEELANQIDALKQSPIRSADTRRICRTQCFKRSYQISHMHRVTVSKGRGLNGCRLGIKFWSFQNEPFMDSLLNLKLSEYIDRKRQIVDYIREDSSYCASFSLSFCWQHLAYIWLGALSRWFTSIAGRSSQSCDGKICSSSNSKCEPAAGRLGHLLETSNLDWLLSVACELCQRAAANQFSREPNIKIRIQLRSSAIYSGDELATARQTPFLNSSRPSAASPCSLSLSTLIELPARYSTSQR